MSEIKELISLSGVLPEFKETKKRDFSKNKITKLGRLKVANNLKPVINKAEELLQAISSLKSKKQVEQAKEAAFNTLFKPESLVNTNDYTLNKKNTLKSPKPKIR